jgi:hypothetical protein
MKLKINQGVLPLHQKTTGANDQVSRGIWIGINIHLTSSRRNIFGNTKSNTCTKNLFTSEISTKTVIQIFSPKYWNSQQLLKWQEIRLCHNGAWRIQRNLPISIFNNCSPKTVVIFGWDAILLCDVKLWNQVNRLHLLTVENKISEDPNHISLFALFSILQQRKFQIDIVWLLIEKNADVNSKTNAGWNALHFVCENHSKLNPTILKWTEIFYFVSTDVSSTDCYTQDYPRLPLHFGK